MRLSSNSYIEASSFQEITSKADGLFSVNAGFLQHNPGPYIKHAQCCMFDHDSSSCNVVAWRLLRCSAEEIQGTVFKMIYSLPSGSNSSRSSSNNNFFFFFFTITITIIKMSATNNNNTDTGTVSLPTLPGQGRQGQAGLPQAPPPLPFDRFIGEWRAWERGLSAEEWHAFYYSLPTREWQGEFQRRKPSVWACRRPVGPSLWLFGGGR
ncbi:Transposase-31 domain containing protein [Pyrenophora tritici-repentis]|nr:Transposase-31 domain containing protein [Pyrenophora tritici-repentis]